jgi:hypothetical protein
MYRRVSAQFLHLSSICAPLTTDCFRRLPAGIFSLQFRSAPPQTLLGLISCCKLFQQSALALLVPFPGVSARALTIHSSRTRFMASPQNRNLSGRVGLIQVLGRMKSFRFFLLITALFTSAAAAHQDRILTVRPDGSIPEIPAALGPVSLKISGLGSPTPSVQFRAGTHINNLPDCATRFIRSKGQGDVFVTGSWYHSESILPYYVSVQFREPGYIATRPYNSSLNILFNLRTTDVIEIKQFVADRSGNGGRYLSVDLPKGCRLNSMRPNNSFKPNPLRGSA